MNDDSVWKDRFMWLVSQHYIEPEVIFRLNLTDHDNLEGSAYDPNTYIQELIAAIDKKLSLNNSKL